MNLFAIGGTDLALNLQARSRSAGQAECSPVIGNGKLWRPVDHEGEVLVSVIKKHRNKDSTLKMLIELIKR
jgi:hypothetical protein